MNNFETQLCDENVVQITRNQLKESSAEIRAHRVNRRVVSRDSRLVAQKFEKREKGEGGGEKGRKRREIERRRNGGRKFHAPRLKPDAEDTLAENVYFETRSRFLHQLTPPSLITRPKF